MLITLFWFLQNSSARSSLIQFHVFTYNQDSFRPFKMAKRNTSLLKKKKKYKDMNFAFTKVIFQSSEKKNSDRIFSLAWNIVYWLRKSHCFQIFFWEGGEWKIRSFLSQNDDGNMIFIVYWRVLVLDFSGMRNTVSFWDKKLMKRWYLLITKKFMFWTTEKFLFWAFRWWRILPFF